MSDLRKLAGNLSAAAAQENCDSYEYDLMQQASVELHQAADLIEQQQARIDELLFENSALHRELRKARNGKDGE